MGLRNSTQFLDEECFFVTTTCQDWLPIFTSPAYFRILVDSLIFVAKKYEVEGRLEVLDRLRFKKREQKFKLWQDRFDDVFIKSREMAATKIEYMRLNPLQAHWNLALRPEDYPYSSAVYYETDSGGALPIVHYMDYF